MMNDMNMWEMMDCCLIFVYVYVYVCVCVCVCVWIVLDCIVWWIVDTLLIVSSYVGSFTWNLVACIDVVMMSNTSSSVR